MSENKSDIMSAFKEKKWGKVEEGEHITDGYSFRGKIVFQKALEGFKSMMQKGLIEEVNGIGIQVLDTRKNGVCLDVDIKCSEGYGGRITGNLGTRFPRNLKVSHEILLVNPAHLL